MMEGEDNKGVRRPRTLYCSCGHWGATNGVKRMLWLEGTMGHLPDSSSLLLYDSDLFFFVV